MLTFSSSENLSQVKSSHPNEDTTLREMRRQARAISNAIKLGDPTIVNEISVQEAPLFSPCQICGKCDLFIYALSHSEVIAFDLLERGYKINGYQGAPHHGYCHTALHMCAENGYLRLLHAILDKQPHLLFLDTEVHPVHLAVLNNQNYCLKAMLDRSQECWASIGASHDSLSSGLKTLPNEIGPWSQQKDAKFRLLESSDLSLVMLQLVDRTLDEALSRDIHTRHLQNDGTLLPLHCAAFIENTIAAQLLLGAGAEKDRIPPGSSSSALCVAIKRCSIGVAEILLERGASLYRYNWWGACGIGLLACYCPKLFLRHRGSFELDVLPNMEGETLMLQVLVNADHKSPPAFFDTTMRKDGLWGVSRRGQSARQFAFIRGDHVASTFLLNAGIDFDMWDENCGGFLNTSWFDDEVSTLKRLIRRIGYEKSMRLLNRKPAQSSTPLYDTAVMGQQEVARTLMRFGADVNADGGILGTPLMAAAAYGRLCIVKDFVDAGAALSCFSIEENRVRSAIDLAKHFPEIQRWLLVGRWTERRRITYDA
jgi:ankyrin repeat protein